MKNLYQAVCLSLTLGCLTQGIHAAGLQKQIEKQKTPIEKALTQQKLDRSENKLLVNNEPIKVLTSISAAPTQNFFAEQNQRFSRLMQTIFPQQPS